MSKRRKKRRRRRLFRTLVLLVLLAAAALFDSNSRIVTTEYEITSAKIPDEFSGFRIVQLSDLHGAYADNMDYLVEKTAEAEPDIIAVTGDLISDADGLSYVTELVPRLTALAPVYYVTGNHEWPSGVIRELFAILSDLGVTVLRNDYVTLQCGGASIVLAGIDDPNGPADMAKPPEVIGRIRENEGDKLTVLLVHRNDWLEKYSDLDVDIALSGHAHGGIVRLPLTDGLVNTKMEWFPSYTSGLYSENGTDMIVSRGVGSAGALRLFNNPHIPVIILKGEI